MSDFRRKAGFGIYIHWPFCASKCPYCDFNSHVSGEIDPDHWLRAYKSAIHAYRAQIDRRVVDSVYFGGGTPSLMPVSLIEGILDTIRAAFSLANQVEITLEANPSSVEAERFKGYRMAGVDRVSLGVQALNSNDLRRLGRLHSVEDALCALATARDTFDRVSFDLIYARQDQSLEQWQAELSQALAMQPQHMSLYQLTIEQGTAFFDRLQRGGLRGLPDEDLGADMYDLTQDMMNYAGLPAYEISNHAADPDQSRHNLIYWRGGDYLGIGPGAHGRLTLDGQRYATHTPLAPGKWLDRVEENATGEAAREALGPSDQLNELLMMGLRMREGLGLDHLQALGFNPNTPEMSTLRSNGMINLMQERITLTDQGRPILNAILRELLV